MKYFIHDNDLCDSPTMQSVIVELGLAGYGRAIIMLETLAKYVKNDGKFLFQLPLDRPMDISYWARKFQQTVEETERTFDAFERSALIGQWRETQTIFAPMLGERLDEYTKRLKPKTPKRRGSKKPKVADGVSGTSSRAKALPGGREPKGLLSDGNEDGDGHKNENGNEDENQHQNEYKNNSRHYRDNVGSSESLKTVDVVDDGSLLPSIKVKDTDKEKPSDGEIMAEYSKAMSTCTLEKPLQSTEPHRKAAIQFYKKHGREVAIAAWVLFLWNSDNSVPGNEDEPRMWRLKDFIDSGEAELWAERVLPYIERGVLSYPALDVLMKVTDNHFAADFDYMVMMEANLSDYGKERLKLTPGLLESGLKVLYEFPNDFVGHTELGHELTRFRKSTWPKDLPGFCQYLTRGEPTLPGVTGPLAEAVAESVAEEEVAQQPFDLLSMMGHWERVPADADHTDSPKNAG